MVRTEDYYTNMQNEFKSSNTIKSSMASRAYYKAVRLAGIASVFNHMDPIIRYEEWEWGKSMIEYEMKGLETFFRGGGMSDALSDMAHRIVGTSIIKILREEVRVNKGLSIKQHKAGRCRLYELTQSLKNNQELIEFNDDLKFRSAPESGMEKILKYMIRQDLVFRVQDGKATTYQVTDTFLASYGE